jgi:tripartite ATP-independent transporter DctP family solute receptor
MRKPNRREILVGLGGMCALPATLARPLARTLTAADVHVDGYPTVLAVRWIGQQLDARTGGRLAIRVYHAGQLGRESDTIDMARFGAIDITRVNFASLNNPFPLTRLFSLPYVFDSVDHMRRAADGEVGRAVLRGFQQRGLVGLAIYDAGSRSFYNTRRPVQEPADLHGLKIRVPPSDIFLELARALGANPTPLPYGEVYSALQTHLIEGAENNWRTFHTSRQFEVARHWSGTHHSYSPEALLISARTLDGLDANDRDLLRQLATESVPYMRGLWDRMEADSRQQVIASGVRTNEVDVASFHRAAAPVLEKYLQGHGLRGLYDSIRALV